MFAQPMADEQSVGETYDYLCKFHLVMLAEKKLHFNPKAFNPNRPMPTDSRYIHCSQTHHCMLTELNPQKILSSKSAACQNWLGQRAPNFSNWKSVLNSC